MTKLRNRIERLEQKAQFTLWFHFSRFLEALTDEQVEEIAIHWRFPDPLPDPLPIGMSSLDGLDKESLLRLWEKEEREISRIIGTHDSEVFPLLWAFLLRGEAAIHVLSIDRLFVHPADAVSCALDPDFLLGRERLARHHVHAVRFKATAKLGEFLNTTIRTSRPTLPAKSS